MADFTEPYAVIRKSLTTPFEPHLVSKLPKTDKRPALDYVSHAVVTARLNAVCPEWTYEITRFIEFTGADGLPHLFAVYGWMEIGGVRRWEVGEADRADAYGRELKGAISDFIRRAAMRFGVALDLWSKADLSGITDETSPVTVSSPPSLGGGATVGAVEDSGHDIGEGVTSEPETAPALPQMGQPEYAQPSKLASDQQWENLLKVTGGSMQKAVNKINAVNKTNYTAATARAGATWDELVAAIV